MVDYTFKYKIGQVVYFKTDKQQDEFLVTGIHISPDGHCYYVSNAGLEHKAYELEISEKRNTALALGLQSQ